MLSDIFAISWSDCFTANLLS